nr:cupin domain-containing protein [Pseudomonadota bacterium]
GIRVKILLADRQRRCAVLVAMAAGATMPAHHHAGGEDMLMLSGDAWIDHHRLQAGDYVRSEAGTAHPPIRTDAGCTFFCLSSLDDHFVIPGREDLPVEAWAGGPPPPA